MNSLNEKCAVFGVYGKGMDTARMTYFGLYALQHRGQESSGIAVSNGRQIKILKGTGLVPQVYTEPQLQKMKGHIAIGHNRYSTSGGSFSEHTQPVGGKHDIVTLAHNGNLPITRKLQQFLSSKGIFIGKCNDSELIHMAIRYYLIKHHSLEDAITNVLPLLTGAYCLLIMTKDKLAAVRDPHGIRPLSIGKANGGYVFSSETPGIDIVDGTFIRDVNPGEMVVVDKHGLKSYQLATPNQKLDIFEFVYFSRPDSVLLGKSVYEVRRNLGVQLAKEYPIKADVVIPVPDSSIPAAIGYAATLTLPFEFGLVKNRYVGRTFILPDQRLRDKSVKMKINPIKELIAGKTLVVIDDSIVRGTTAKKLVKMLRDAGAKKVHLLSSSPPVRFPDFYGIDTPLQKDLIAAHMSIKEIETYVGADSLNYLSYQGLIKATGLPESTFCTSCFTGEYPIAIGPHKKRISYTFKDPIR